jgi:hypothetical protein
MTPTEILTLAPLAALTVVFGLFPGLVLSLIQGTVANVLGDAGREGAIAISQPAAVIAIALPLLYLVGRLIWVARIDLSGRGPGAGERSEPAVGIVPAAEGST